MLWFRNALWYRFTSSAEFDEAMLLEALEGKPFIPCRGAEPKSLGFSAVVPGLLEAPVFTSQGFHLIALQSEEKILPATVVNDAVNEKVEQIEADESRKVFRKEKQQMKDEIRLTLLPRAFSRRRLVRALIAPQQGWIIVDSTSNNQADELLNLLRDALGSLKVELVTTQQAPSRCFSNWVTEQAPVPGKFELGSDAEMRDPLESSSQIKVKGQELTQPEVQAHISGGMVVERLNLIWNDQIDLMLHSDLSLKRLKLTQEYQESLPEENSEDALLQLDADLARLGMELTQLIPDIIEALGGSEAI